MLLHQPTVDALIDSMAPSAEDVQSRKDFLGFGEHEAQLLKELGPMLAPLEDALAESFYSHLEANPETRAMLGGTEQIARLKQKQREYFKQVLGGDYGSDYIRSRLHVGVTHQQIGLEPRWYLGAYGKYLSWLLPEVMRLVDNDSEPFLVSLFSC
jgi:chemotaxis family two-component system sensor kinase Cph1